MPNTEPPELKTLFETDRLKLVSQYERTVLIEKDTGKVLFEHEFYGDPSCGLIDAKNKWAMIGGEFLIVWTPDSWCTIQNAELRWIHAIRVKNESVAEILTDPWSERSAIWEISLEDFKFRKIRDFEAYKTKEYTEEVMW